MTYAVEPGSTADLELKVYDKAGVLVNVFLVEADIFDRDGVQVGSTLGAAWEADGTYVVFWGVPSAAVEGHLYRVTWKVTTTPSGRIEKVSYPVVIRKVST